MKKSLKTLILAVLLLAVAGALGVALTSKPQAPASTFTTLEGKPVSLESLRGKIVLVNFWATSCPGCVAEMPHLIETYNEFHKRGFEIVAVAMQYDPPSYVANFVQTRGLPFPVALDVDGSHAKDFGDVAVTPTAFLIGKNGEVLQQTLGDVDFAALKALLDKELT